MKASAIYIAILLLLSLVLLSLPFVHVPITSSARGIIRASDENTAIISLASGAVVASKLLRNNQAVQKGDTLLVITSAGIRSKKSSQNLLVNEQQAQVADLNNLLIGRHEQLRTAQYKQELFALQGQMATYETQLQHAKRDLERNSQLFERRVISHAEYDKSKYAYEELQQQLKLIKEQQMAIWQGKKKELEQRLLAMQGDLMELDIAQENYIIRASASGRLTNFKGVPVGTNLLQGQHIADISPDENLLAECMLSPKDIGFIRLHQAVKLQMDTYNYNQWGMLDAEVIDIDYNVVVNEQTGASYFKVRCKLKENYLSLNNNYKVQIAKGSSFTARFYLLERTLWQLIFDRADDWFNPALINPETHK